MLSVPQITKWVPQEMSFFTSFVNVTHLGFLAFIFIYSIKIFLLKISILCVPGNKITVYWAKNVKHSHQFIPSTFWNYGPGLKQSLCTSIKKTSVWTSTWKLAVRWGKRKKLWELHTDSETEKENVENNPLVKHVPMGLPSSALSSRCRRSNFMKILATRAFSTPLLFPLSVLASDNVAFDKTWSWLVF